jgi:adenylate cyclase
VNTTEVSGDFGAIVFTDIVGFTRFNDVEGDDVAVALLERQEAVVRTALPDCGRLVTEIGDGLLLWYTDAAAALLSCFEMQRGFEEESAHGLPLWVRMGVHWGCPRWRADDIVGRDVNLASRIADLAGAGEILCSDAVVGAVRQPDEVSFESLGPVFVKGIADPIQLHRASRIAAQVGSP